MKRTAENSVERFSSELSCLLELGALSAEEAEALGKCLDELKRRLLRVVPASAEASIEWRRQQEAEQVECAGLAKALAADLDLAFRRLTVAGQDQGEAA